LVHVSPGSQTLLPHVGGQVPQSPGQLLQSSPASHFPLPHTTSPQPPHWFLHSPTQTWSQLIWQQKGSIAHTQASHAQPLQPGVDFVWQPSHCLQSFGQLAQSSVPGVQKPSPQVEGQGPQSLGQLQQLSLLAHFPSPHAGQLPQSLGQLVQFSPAQLSQTPFPQPGQAPQSCGQVVQDSGELHFPSPQNGQ
jgi:hypothetical protein